MKNEIEQIAKKWLNVNECSMYLGLTQRAVYCLVHRGRLNPYRQGRRLYFLIHELDEMLFDGKVVGSSEGLS